MELSEKKSKAQIYLLLGAARQVLSGMSGRKSPADRELAAFINRMISKAPADRPHDWEEIKNVLQQIRARTPDGGKNPRRLPGKQFFSLIISIIFLILAAGIAFAVFKLF